MDASQVGEARRAGVTVKPARIAAYRVTAGNNGFRAREIATIAGEVRIGREPSEVMMTDRQAEAARAADFELEELAQAEAAE